MPKSQQTEEVRILKFFEEAPLEQAEMLFNIVREKIRQRSATDPRSQRTVTKRKTELAAGVKGAEEAQRGPPDGKLVP
jgi:secreted protein with Ig-like and vWFA domain